MFINTLLYTHSLYSVYTINTQDITVKNVSAYMRPNRNTDIRWKMCNLVHLPL